MADVPEEFQKRVVYSLPGMESVRVRRDERYKAGDDFAYTFDVYYPPDFAPPFDTLRTRPCVVFIHGEGPPEILKNVKDWGQYVSWGQLAAASGLVAVTFNHRSSERFVKLYEVAGDVDDLIHHVRGRAADLGIDPDRIGLWVCSGGTPVGLRAALLNSAAFVKCAVVYYGRTNLEMMREQIKPEATDAMLREFSPELLLQTMDAAQIAPILIARAGRDALPMVNETLDRFVRLAIEKNAAIEFINHPNGEHGFDVYNDDERSREIIARTLGFLSSTLKSPRKPGPGEEPAID